MSGHGIDQIKISEATVTTNQPVSSSAQDVGLSDKQIEYRVAPPHESDYSNSEQTSSSSSKAATNDSHFDKQWALSRIQVLDAWQITLGRQDIIIAVLDTGIDQNHEDLKGKVVAEVNFTDSPTPSDIHGHGTHIAGIITANSDNGIGIAGIAP
jgi:thermitase